MYTIGAGAEVAAAAPLDADDVVAIGVAGVLATDETIEAEADEAAGLVATLDDVTIGMAEELSTAEEDDTMTEV